MAVNLFEGGKRLLRVFQGGIFIAALGYSASLPSIYPLTYDLHYPKGGWVRAENACNTNSDVLEYVERDHGNQTYSLSLCFKAKNFNGSDLIPFTIDENNMVSGDGKSSPSVVRYVKRQVKDFNIPEEDLENFPSVFEDDRFWKQISIVISAAILMGLIEFIGRITGWVIRGFIKGGAEIHDNEASNGQ